MKSRLTRNRIGIFVLILIGMAFPATDAIAQNETGSIAGHITDSSGGLLQGAEIKLQPTDRIAVSNQQGSYLINTIAPGSYTITVTYVGFSLFTKAVSITAGQTTSLDVTMQVSSQNEQILVTAQAVSGEAEAINRERTADNILQVMTNEVMTSLPNANIADAVGRLPSVTLERDEGEGKYIQIRSLEPRLTNATIDGVNIPSPEPGVREIKFDAMPADLVESVEVSKTLQANMDGDGIGGSVNIVTKTAGERPTLSFSGGGGTTPIDGGRHIWQTSGTVGERFGQDKRWGALIGGSYDFNGRGIDDIEPVPDVATFPTGSTTRYFDTQDMRQYLYKRGRWGLTGSSDYKLGDGSDIYVRGIYSSFRDYGDKWVYTLTDNTPLFNSLNPGQYPNGIALLGSNGCTLPTPGDPTNPQALETCGAGVPAFSESNRVPVFNIGSLVVGGKHVFATSWFSWDASVSRSEQLKSGGNEGADFATNATYNNLYPNGSTCQFSPSLTTHVYLPQWTPSCFTEAYSPANYDLADITTSFGKSPQLNLQFTAAYAKRYHVGSHLSTIEIGGKFRNAHKFDDSYTPEYTPNGSIPMTQFLGAFQNNDYYSGDYKVGPTTNWGKVINYLNANPSAFSLVAGTTGVNVGNFDYVEKVSAGFVMDTIDFNRVRFVAGVRLEGTNLDTATPAFDSNNNFLGNTLMNGSYLKVLPSASVRFDLGHDTDLRVVYSRALSRPDPQDIAQALSVTLNQTPLLASLGNPALKAETANNYDVLMEHYLKPFGMIQGGFFYKQLYEPIVTQSFQKENYTPDPANSLYPVGTWIVSQPVNAGSGWLAGFECAYLQNFTSLPGALSGLGLSANYSYTNSQASGLPGRSDSPRLLRQAPNTFNISPTYDHGRLSLRVGMTYNGASIYAYQYQDGTDGSTPTPGGLHGPDADTYLYAHFQLDAQASIR
ncbi:MAG TPA: TonB-dependent receptor, partial [Candidatus Acidoferrum sp.]|nr:TonB-dependent receptor [Candidatus Acidoferrum sp.]